MKRLLYLFAFTSIQLISQTQAFQWVEGFGGKGADISTAVTTDVFGNVYVTGNYSDTCDFDPGPGIYTLSVTSPQQMFVAKYNASGSFIWVKQLGSAGGFSSGRDIAFNSNVVYVTGLFSGTVDFDPGPATYTLTSVVISTTGSATDGFLLRLDSAGTFLSAINVGIPDVYESNCNIAVNTNGAGFLAQTSGTNSSLQTIVIRSLNGSPTSTISPVTGTDNVTFGGIAVDNAGNRIVSGSFRGKATFGSNTLTSVAGTFDVFMAMFSPAGTLVWVKKIGGAYDDTGARPASDGSNLYVTGYYGGIVDFDPGAGTYSLGTLTNDAFILKLNGSGNFIFARSMQSDSTSVSYGYGVESDALGNIYLNGSFYGAVDLDPSPAQAIYTNYNSAFFLSKYSSSGNLVWTQLATSPDLVYCADVAIQGNGSVYTVGRFAGIADFNAAATSQTMTACCNQKDIFLMKSSEPVGIQKFSGEETQLTVFPNPCENSLQINSGLSGEITLITSTGSEVMKKNISAAVPCLVDLKDLAKGVYLLKFLDDKQHAYISRRFVKE